MSKTFCLLIAMNLFVMSAMAQVSPYPQPYDPNRFASADATPEVRSYAPYDTVVRPDMNRSNQVYYPPGWVDGRGQGSPENRINPPVPYIFAPISPSGPFLLR